MLREVLAWRASEVAEARPRRALRRGLARLVGAWQVGGDLTLGGVTVDPYTREVSDGRVPFTLSGRELELLVRLMEAAGDVVSRQKLLQEIWGDDQQDDEEGTRTEETWTLPRGGSGALPRALARVIEANGGEIVTDRTITSVDELEGADAVLLDLTPRQVLGLRGEEPLGEGEHQPARSGDRR